MFTDKCFSCPVLRLPLLEIPVLRQSGEESFCLDFSCFVLCIKAKNEVGIGAKPHYISNTYKYYLDGYVAGGACPDLSGGRGWIVCHIRFSNYYILNFIFTFKFAHDNIPKATT